MKINKEKLVSRIVSGALMASLLILFGANAATNEDIVIPEILAISGEATVAYGNAFPGPVTRTIRDTSKTAIYYASVRVVNPTKKIYKVKIECVDELGKVVISGVVDRESYDVNESKYLGGKSSFIEAKLVLDPKLGAMVPGQTEPLKGEHGYYVRLYVDDTLVGLTRFRYILMGESTKDLAKSRRK